MHGIAELHGGAVRNGFMQKEAGDKDQRTLGPGYYGTPVDPFCESRTHRLSFLSIHVMALSSVEQFPLTNGLLKMGIISKIAVQVPGLLIVSSTTTYAQPPHTGALGCSSKSFTVKHEVHL